MVRVRPPRPAALLVLVVAWLLVGAGTAAAHVTVTPDAAPPGSYTTLSFRVPNESETASTVRVEIRITDSAEDPAFASVLTRQLAGWSAEIVTATPAAPVRLGDLTLDEVVTTVVFTAEDGGIGPGQFATFDVLVGPVPELPSLLFPTVQTYSDGAVVSWDQETPPSGVEPERPAPVLAIEGESAAHAHGADPAGDAADTADAADGTSETAVPGSTGDSRSAAAAEAGRGSSDGLARILAIIAILIGVIAVATGFGGRRPARGAGTWSVTSPIAGFPGMTAPGEPRPPGPADPGGPGGDR